MKIRQEAPRTIPTKSIEGVDKHTFSLNGLEIDVYRLIDLTKENSVAEVPISQLFYALKEPSWTDEEGQHISLFEVVQAYRETGHNLKLFTKQHPKWVRHMNKILYADLSHPIIIFKGIIIDGLHRLAKEILLENNTIQAKILSSIPEEAILKGHGIKSYL